MSNRLTSPTIIILFGITGDLAYRTLFPALWQLYVSQQLPERVKIIGVARRDWSDETLRYHVAAALLENKVSNPQRDKFLSLFHYCRNEISQINPYQALEKQLASHEATWEAAAHKLFYLATPPSLYSPIFRSLSLSQLVKINHPTWTRVMIEKPFGHDLTSAQMLNEQIGLIFNEDQIYRIDHYLAKEALTALTDLQQRLASQWGAAGIESIEIKLLETLDVTNRADSYDPVGALHDTIQNHLLEILAFILAPLSGHSQNNERQRRAQALQSLKSLTTSEVKTQTERAQYSGYLAHEGIRPSSQTETYAKVTVSSDDPQWQGVPFILESGKAMPETVKEIRLAFRPTVAARERKETVVFSLEDKINFPHAYLIRDGLLGNQQRFVSQDEVVAAWRFIDPIRHAWDNNAVPLTHYAPNTPKS